MRCLSLVAPCGSEPAKLGRRHFPEAPRTKQASLDSLVRHTVVTQSVAGNQSLNSSDSSLHHTHNVSTQCTKELSLPPRSLRVLPYLSRPLLPSVVSLMLLKNKCFSQLSLPCDLLAVFNCGAASFIVTWSAAESWQNGICVRVLCNVRKCVFGAR